jgi:hypothetical protein
MAPFISASAEPIARQDANRIDKYRIVRSSLCRRHAAFDRKLPHVRFRQLAAELAREVPILYFEYKCCH